MSVAFGSPARVVRSLDDIRPSDLGSAAATNTLADAMALGNRLPMQAACSGGKPRLRRRVHPLGDDDLDSDDDEDLALDDVVLSQTSGSCSFGLAGTTTQSERRRPRARRLSGAQHADPLRQRRTQQHRLRRSEIEAAAAAAMATVVVGLLMVSFFAVVYLGTKRLSLFGV